MEHFSGACKVLGCTGRAAHAAGLCTSQHAWKQRQGTHEKKATGHCHTVFAKAHSAFSAAATSAQVSPLYPPPCRQKSTAPLLPARYTLRARQRR